MFTVPQWKRELLKRIQSKNLRMIAEQQQVDILEEHIPKVSDNIFVTHEKKPQRLPSAPTIRSISNEVLIPATPTYTIEVDNIIIIEKDDKGSTKEVHEKTPSIDDKKEYPKAGIVHRLLGRFQTGESDSQPKKSPAGYTSHQKIEQQLETSENYRLSQGESPTPTADQVSSVKELSTTESVFSIEESEPQSESAMQSDMLSPLLISSAKPFSRQRSDNTDRFHHVNKPIRKVSAPVSAKNSVPKPEPKAVLPVEVIPCPPEFADDLLHLHANAQESERNVTTKETIVIQKEMLPSVEPPIPKRVSLKNGETLHSSGTESSKKHEMRLQGNTKPPVPIKRFDPYASLHDKSNIYSRQRQPKVETKETVKANSVLYPKAAASTHTVQSEVTVKEPPKSIDHKSNAQTALKENRMYSRSAARRRDNLENEFKKVVHESLDETTLKSSAAKAANRIMQTSTTFKITPSKQAERTVVSPPRKPDTTSKVDSMASNNSHESYNTTAKSSSSSLTSVKPPTIPLRRHEIETPIVHETATVPIIVKEEPKTIVDTPTPVVKSNVDTVSSSIFNNPPEPKVAVDTPKPTGNSTDNMVNSSMFEQSEPEPVVKAPRFTGNSTDNIVNSSVFKRSEPEPVVEAPRPTGKSTDNRVSSSLYKPPVSTVPKQKEVPSTFGQSAKPQQVPSQPKTLPTVNSAPKSPMKVQSESKPSIFGPRITKSSSSSNRGKSFTIDPSKFKRSSAQPPATSATSGSYQDGSSTRTIIPGAKSQINTDLEFGGDQPKSGKRKLTVDQITVIGGYVTLEKSCLIKGTKRKKSVTLSFSEKGLETTYSYVSERSLLEEDQPSVEFKQTSKSPGFGKDSTIGKYTPKYLLSMKSSEILDNEDDSNESKSVKDSSGDSPSTSSHATPLSDENAITWSDTTSGSTDILF